MNGELQGPQVCGRVGYDSGQQGVVLWMSLNNTV